jgi:hypothetical protein
MVASIEPQQVEPRPLPITQANRIPVEPPSSIPRLVIGAAAIVFALALILLSVPRLGAALELARSKAVYDSLQANQKGIDDDALEAGIASVTRGFADSSEPYLGVMLAYLHMAQADRTTNRALADQRLLKAAEAARATIRVSPSNLVAWVLLAMALDSRDPRDPATLAALARSIHIAPYDPRLLGFRISLAMRHWSRLDDASRKLAGGQIRRIGQQNLRYLAQVTRDSFGLPAVREAMKDTPALKARFDVAYLSLSE